MLIQFEYVSYTTLKSTLNFLAENGMQSKIIAGGTDLMISLRTHQITPNYIVDITRIASLHFICEQNDEISIGPLVTHTELAESSLVHRYANLLSRAAQSVGSPQIRNLGTIGGNIVNASPAADIIPVLVALDAQLKIQSIKSERYVGITDIFDRPYSTILKPDEILTEIRFKKLLPSERSTFIKLARRNALAVARMNIAVISQLDPVDNKILKIRISPGSVTPTPRRIRSAEEILLNKIPDEELIKQAALSVSREMIKQTGIRWSTAYKKPVIETLSYRALKEVISINN